MKNLRITVNGTAYDVQVEELGGSSAPVAAAPAPVAAAPAPAAKPAGLEVKQCSISSRNTKSMFHREVPVQRAHQAMCLAQWATAAKEQTAHCV